MQDEIFTKIMTCQKKTKPKLVGASSDCGWQTMPKNSNDAIDHLNPQAALLTEKILYMNLVWASGK